jgi:competence protein ComEA
MLRLLAAVAFALFAHAALAVVNLNSATKDELVALPGIGPVKAQAIIDYRTQHGGFKSVEELKDVKGIGAKRFEKLKADIAVGGKPAVTAAAKPDAKGGQTARGEVRSADAKPK